MRTFIRKCREAHDDFFLQCDLVFCEHCRRTRIGLKKQILKLYVYDLLQSKMAG